MKNELTSLPNISDILAAKLEKVGINGAKELKEIGSEQAIIRIATIENSGACINMLYALEGAVQGIRWHNLPQSRKAALRKSYKMMIKNKEQRIKE